MERLVNLIRCLLYLRMRPRRNQKRDSQNKNGGRALPPRAVLLNLRRKSKF